MEKIVYNVLRKVAVLPVYQIYASLTTTIATITSIVFPCISSDFHLIHRIACADSAEYDWLRQDLRLWDSGSCSKTPSTTQKERRYTPVKVEHRDVEKDIEGYLNKADNLKRRFQKVESLTATTVWQNLADIAGSVVASTCDFVSKKQSGSSVMYGQEIRLEVPPNLLAEERKSKNSDQSRSVDKVVRKTFYYAKPLSVDI